MVDKYQKSIKLFVAKSSCRAEIFETLQTYKGFSRVIYSILNGSAILERGETRLERNETRLKRNETRYNNFFFFSFYNIKKMRNFVVWFFSGKSVKLILK